MLVFGEIRSFETPASDTSIDENSSMFVVYYVAGRPPDSTVASRAAVITPKTAAIKPYKSFLFNRPITQLQGQRLILQVIQTKWTGAQILVGYGYCDLDIAPNSHTRIISVPLWRPRTNNEDRDRLCGTFSPLSDVSVVTLPDYVDPKDLEIESQLGRVVIHIQRSEYC